MRLSMLKDARQLLRDKPKFEYLWSDHRLRPRLRSLYSVRLYKANAFERWDHYLEKLRGSDARPWAEIERIRTEISKEVQEHPVDDVLRLPLLDLADDLGPARESLAQLRLLRVALAFRRTGSPPPLADPFGGTIEAEVSGTSLKAWSKGMGVMDRSKSGWQRASDMMKALDRGSILIEMER